MTMRRFMNLCEDATSSQTVFTGSIDATGIANLLPGIHDVASFVSALAKIKNNQQIKMSGAEHAQMGAAFMSLLAASQADRQQVIAKMAPLHNVPATTPANTASAAVAGATVGDGPTAAVAS